MVFFCRARLDTAGDQFAVSCAACGLDGFDIACSRIGFMIMPRTMDL